MKHLKALIPHSIIGSVAEFQGQERKVIILSAVRSNFKLCSNDQRFGLGFLSNQKQINVAISRAQFLLVIVGNSSLLSTNDKWRAIINYATTNCTYVDMEEQFFKSIIDQG